MTKADESDTLHQLIFDKLERDWKEVQKIQNAGTVPYQVLLIEFATAEWGTAECIDPPLQTWIYDGQQWVDYLIHGVSVTSTNKLGRLFINARVRFCIHPDRSQVVWESLLGPRWGRGQIYKLLMVEHEYRLVLERTVWVS